MTSDFRPRRVHVVSHTHWDREWYRTFHAFRVDLSHVVKRVLTALEHDPAFEHFLLDGQAVVLEDHLEVCPEDTARIRALVASGALQIGPWFVLPDEFLVSGESLVRNLLLGHAVCRRFGKPQTVGYMPDSFGHPAQVPQILREGGMDAFVYTRGDGSELEETGHEYVWEAPDGSSVTAIQQCGGYCNGGGLGFEEIRHAHTQREVRTELAVARLRAWFATVGRLSNGDVVLLNNGCDHVPPQQDFARVMDSLRAAFPEVEFVHSTLGRYLADVREGGFATKTRRGELREGRYSHILSGVWSSRMPLKQRNDRSQRLLADTEALCAYTHFVYGREMPRGTLTHCRRTLLLNHPHDSICGCSIDAVHRDMIARFDAVDGTARQVVVRELGHLAPSFARTPAKDQDTVICVFNPLPCRRTEIVRRLVVLQPFGIDAKDLCLVDENERTVPFRIVGRRFVERFWGVDYRTMLDPNEQAERLHGYLRAFGDRIERTEADKNSADCFLYLEFVAELPALGHVNYRLTARPSSAPAPAITPVAADGRTVENELVRVEVAANGTLTLRDKRSGREWAGLALWEDVGDAGDSYDFAPCGPVVTSAGSAANASPGEPAGWLARSILVGMRLSLPARLDRKGDTPRRVGAVDHPVVIRVLLTPGSPVVDLEVKLALSGNRAEDHRLRLLFPDLAATTTVVSDGQFYADERSVHRAPDDAFCQPHADTFPQQDFSLLQDDAGGMAVLVRGLPEVAPLPGNDGRLGLAVTLLRSVGWLSRDDVPTRRNESAGPTIATPEAQCAGPHTFRLALVPFGGDRRTAGIRRLSERWRHPPLAVQGVEDNEQRGSADFLAVIGDATSVTAVKCHEERDTLVVRLFNDTPTALEETLRCGRKVAGAWRVDLLENRTHPLSVFADHVAVPLRAHGIATVEIEFAP